jgi:hypothetical protein
MTTLADLQSRALRELVGTRTLSRTLVNLQNATATFDGVSEPDAIMRYDIGGVQCTTADVTNKALATLAALQNPVTGYDGYIDQPVSTTVYYVACVNAAGTVYVIQGTYDGQVLGGSLAIGPRGDGSIPQIAVPDTYAPFAVFKVVNGTNAVFTPGTTNWDATGVDAYAVPVSVLPASIPADALFVAGGA